MAVDQLRIAGVSGAAINHERERHRVRDRPASGSACSLTGNIAELQPCIQSFVQTSPLCRVKMRRTSLHGHESRALLSASLLVVFLLPQRTHSFLAPSHAVFAPELRLPNLAQSCLISPRSACCRRRPCALTALRPLKHVCALVPADAHFHPALMRPPKLGGLTLWHTKQEARGRRPT